MQFYEVNCSLNKSVDRRNRNSLVVETKSKVEQDYLVLLQDNNTYEIVRYLGEDENVSIPEEINGIKVTKIGPCAFYESKIKAVDVPSSVEYIGDYAFGKCYYLGEAILNEGVKSLGFAVFNYDGAMKKVSLPNSLEHIEEVLMVGGKNLEYTIYDDAKYLGNEQNPYLLFCKTVSRDTKSCEVHEGCKFISDSAFFFRRSLEKVIIPESVKEIGKNAFDCVRDVKVETYNNYALEYCKEHGLVTDNGQKGEE